MISSTRTLLVLAGLAALVVPSQATITFSSFTSDFTLAPSITNQINATPPQLSNFPKGTGTVTDTGSFDVSSTFGITALDVNEVDGFAFGGSVSLDVTLWTGTTLATEGPALATLYSQSASGSALIPPFQNNPLTLAGTHLVTYTAQYVGASKTGIGYLGGFAVDAYEAVPEPAAYAALGVGIVGLLARRRRSGK
jgi:hypothetical protein